MSIIDRLRKFTPGYRQAPLDPSASQSVWGKYDNSPVIKSNRQDAYERALVKTNEATNDFNERRKQWDRNDMKADRNRAMSGMFSNLDDVSNQYYGNTANEELVLPEWAGAKEEQYMNNRNANNVALDRSSNTYIGHYRPGDMSMFQSPVMQTTTGGYIDNTATNRPGSNRELVNILANGNGSKLQEIRRKLGPQLYNDISRVVTGGKRAVNPNDFDQYMRTYNRDGKSAVDGQYLEKVRGSARNYTFE